jgi:hypothetical protein
MHFSIAPIVLAVCSSFAAAAVIERQTGGIITCTCLNDLTLRAALAESQNDSTYTCYYGSSNRSKADHCTYNQVRTPSLAVLTNTTDDRL